MSSDSKDVQEQKDADEVQADAVEKPTPTVKFAENQEASQEPKDTDEVQADAVEKPNPTVKFAENEEASQDSPLEPARAAPSPPLVPPNAQADDVASVDSANEVGEGEEIAIPMDEWAPQKRTAENDETLKRAQEHLRSLQEESRQRRLSQLPARKKTTSPRNADAEEGDEDVDAVVDEDTPLMVYGRYDDTHHGLAQDFGEDDGVDGVDPPEVREEGVIQSPYIIGSGDARCKTKRLIKATIVEATGFESVWHSLFQSAPNPYASVMNGEDEVYSTKKVFNSRSPAWLGETYFLLRGEEEQQTFSFTLHIFDYGNFLPPSWLGSGEFDLSEGERWINITTDSEGLNPPTAKVRIIIENVTVPPTRGKAPEVV